MNLVETGEQFSVALDSLGVVWVSTVEQRGNTLNGCKDLYPQAKARIWP
jgi:hypothetical protein